MDTPAAKYPPSGYCAWMTFHFLSFVEMVLWVFRDALRSGLLKGQDTFPCCSSFLFFLSLDSLQSDPWSSVSNSLLDLSSSLWSWISFTQRSVSLDFTTWDVSIGLATSIPSLSRLFTIWTSKTGPIIVPSGIAATTWDSRKDRENVHSRQRRAIILHPSSPFGRTLCSFLAVARYWKWAFSHICVSCI